MAVGPRDSTAGGEASTRDAMMTASPGGTSSPPLPSRDSAFAPPGAGCLSGHEVRDRERGGGKGTRPVENKEPYVAGRKRGSSDDPEPTVGGDGSGLGGQDGRFEKRSRAIATDQQEQSPGILSPDSHGFSPGAQADKLEV